MHLAKLIIIITGTIFTKAEPQDIFLHFNDMATSLVQCSALLSHM